MATSEISRHDAAYWYVPIVRAVPAAVIAIIITFSPDHSPTLGFLAFGGFAVISGLIVAAGSYRTLEAGVTRTVFFAQSIISVLAGIVALLWPGAGIGFLLFLVSAWAALTGFLELYAGLRSRRKSASSRDWLFIGGLTALFAVVVLLLPPDYAHQYTGPDGVDRVLTTSIIMVGALGAYAAIVAVYLVIGGLSLKWAPVASSTAAPVLQDGPAS